jgi:hypothetical protein
MAKRENMEIEAQSADPGQFTFANMPLYDDFQIETDITATQAPEGRINLADLIWLQEYILGKRTLTQFELVAADIDLDHKIRTRDLAELRKKILRGETRWSHGKTFRLLFEPGTITAGNLGSFSATGNVMKYDGRFDFRAVLLGDLTEANSPETENRSSATWEIRETEQGTAIFATEDIEVKGIQWAFRALKTDVKPESEILNLLPQNLFADGTGGYRFVQTDAIRIEAREPILWIPGVKPDDLVFGEGSWVTKQGLFQEIEVRKRPSAHAEHTLYPNPVSGENFRYEGSGKIMSILSVNGTEIPFRQNAENIEFENNLPPGLYQVYIRDENGHVSVKKLTKLP